MTLLFRFARLHLQWSATMSGIPTYRMIRKLGSRGRCASSHTSGIATHRERTPQQAHALIEALGLSLYEKTLCCSTLAALVPVHSQLNTGSPQQPQGMHTSAIYLASCTQLNHDTLSWFSASISSGCLQQCSSSKTPASLSISLSVMRKKRLWGAAEA